MYIGFLIKKNVCAKEVKMLGDSQTAAAHPAKSKRRLIHKMYDNFVKRKNIYIKTYRDHLMITA